MSSLRTIARGVAHNRMKKRGLIHVNKQDYTGRANQRSRIDSYFASHWRDYTRYGRQKEEKEDGR